MILSDFNEITIHFEKWGSRLLLEYHIDGFSNVLSFYELRDLSFIGYPFTWCNNREGES